MRPRRMGFPEVVKSPKLSDNQHQTKQASSRKALNRLGRGIYLQIAAINEMLDCTLMDFIFIEFLQTLNQLPFSDAALVRSWVSILSWWELAQIGVNCGS